MQYPGFIGGTYVAQSPISDQEETINWYVERTESESATSQAQLYPTPGVTSLSTHTSQPGRAHFEHDGVEYAVIGTDFGTINSVGGFTAIGTVAIDANPATICSNGDGGGEIFITSGGNGYLYDTGTAVFSTIAALSGKATMGDQLDGYFLAFDANTSTFYVSDLLDGTTWDATQFAQRSTQADPWVTMRVNPANRYIYLIGSQTGEVWYDSGAAPFPFALNPAGSIPYGCAAPFSMEVCDGSMTWLGANASGTGMVLTAAGLTPQIISTFPLEYALNQFSNISDGIGDTYRDLGHTFYLLTLPTAGLTLAYDFNTPSPHNWAKRGTWISENSAFTYWRAAYHAYAYGQHRMLDLQTGDIYHMSSAIYTDVDSRELRRVRRAPSPQFELQRLNFSAMELDLETGLGNAAAPGDDPQVMLRYSDDGGKTWGNEIMAAAGKLGEYSTRVRWTRLGTGRRRVFEVSVSDPIPWRIINAYLTMLQPPKRASQVQQAQWSG